MGGAVSSGRDNNELIDNLMSGNYIRTKEVERVFRALDRAEYMTPEAREQAYKDLAWRNGPLHLSSPCIYSEVMEGLELKPGLSFLNIGSGTGYLSTLAGLILGTAGISHGVEVHPAVVEYATKKIRLFFENCSILDDFDFCEPKFYHGNGLCLEQLVSGYDRVYCGAGCPEQYEDYFKKLIKVGGILVMPLNDTLLQVRRLGEDKWTSRSLLNVSFATLRIPTAEEATNKVTLDKQTPVRLMYLARASIRESMRGGVTRRNPELREAPRPPPPAACPRRICIPLEPGGAVEGLNVLHDLDGENGGNEMNALLSLVISMGQSRVAGALRFDRLTPSDSEDEDEDDDNPDPDSENQDNDRQDNRNQDNPNQDNNRHDNRNQDNNRQVNRNQEDDPQDNRNQDDDRLDNPTQDNNRQDNRNQDNNRQDNRNQDDDRQDNGNQDDDDRDNHDEDDDYPDNRDYRGYIPEEHFPEDEDPGSRRLGEDELNNPPRNEPRAGTLVTEVLFRDYLDSDDEDYLRRTLDSTLRNYPTMSVNDSSRPRLADTDDLRLGDPNSSANTSTSGNPPASTTVGNDAASEPSKPEGPSVVVHDGFRPRAHSTDEKCSNSRKSGRTRSLYGKSRDPLLMSLYENDTRPSTSCDKSKSSTDTKNPTDLKGETTDNITSQDPNTVPPRPELPGMPSEVEIDLGKMAQAATTSTEEMAWEETRRDTLECSEDDTDTSNSKPKRQKLDSGIGETTPSVSSPEKTKSENSDTESHLHSDCPTEDAEGSREGSGGSRSPSYWSASPEELAHQERRRRLIARGGDARRARLSYLMKQAVRELPLPHALKKFVNLGRCFEF
ncbi:dentin matrix acidic phosphoprotein 1-like isoform X2 [Maniola jurtina]|uniref:dentin matrix acidic phosphoprotein 1-like isoform X2 n=1 Tax=Maniola jurtina TaxID=191418 RepID=UPI001E68CDB6|nr:dentin matrix acidic phosphoprotein 1-like isoform X2 [Maniola jurtina]